jgi:hypothetical protein
MATTSSAHHSINSQLEREVFSCVGPVAKRIISVFILYACGFQASCPFSFNRGTTDTRNTPVTSIDLFLKKWIWSILCSPLFSISASSLFCGGRLNRDCSLHTSSVTETPPGRPSGAAACIACGGVRGAFSPQKMYPVHQSYPHQRGKIPIS